MKLKTTKKAMKENTHPDNLISIGYCGAQYLLNSRQPFAYSAGANGWACDYYELEAGVIISTGYSPIGRQVDVRTLRKYEAQACNAWSSGDYDSRCRKVERILKAFVREIMKA